MYCFKFARAKSEITKRYSRLFFQVQPRASAHRRLRYACAATRRFNNLYGSNRNGRSLPGSESPWLGPGSPFNLTWIENWVPICPSARWPHCNESLHRDSGPWRAGVRVPASGPAVPESRSRWPSLPPQPCDSYWQAVRNLENVGFQLEYSYHDHWCSCQRQWFARELTGRLAHVTVAGTSLSRFAAMDSVIRLSLRDSEESEPRNSVGPAAATWFRLLQMGPGQSSHPRVVQALQTTPLPRWTWP